MATKWVLAAVDGTGSRDWRRADGDNSHVWKFHRDFQAPGGLKRYFDGPSTFGTDVQTVRRNVATWLIQTLRPFVPPSPGGERCVAPRDDIRVCLAGHSRGGLISVELARELSMQGYPVYFLALYDAVDMALNEDGSYIANVQVTYHAIRDPSIGSRSSWGNTGRSGDTKYYERKFLTTHGGIGGDVVLAPTGVTADYACDTRTLKADIMKMMGQDLGTLCTTQSRQADAWIRAGARGAGVPVH